MCLINGEGTLRKMNNFNIKKATIDDIDQLLTIVKQTFIETYAAQNSEENLNSYVKNNFSTTKLKAELADKNAEFYIAEFGGELIGYLKINFGPSQTEIKDKNALEIERIYVLNEFHAKKVGQALCEKAIEISKAKKLEYVWLGVWEKNPRAIRFYEKNGFVQFDTHIFKLGNDKQTDFLMKLEISSSVD